MTSRIERYGGRNWAVYLDGGVAGPELVAVCLYRRGAVSVQALLDALIVSRQNWGGLANVT